MNRSLVGDDLDAGTVLPDFQNALVAPHGGAMFTGEPELGRDAVFRPQHAGARLEVAHFIAAQLELRIARDDLPGVEPLMLDAKALGEGEAALHEILPAVMSCRAGARRHDEAAGLDHERLAALLLQLAPDRVRATHHRGVGIALADGEPRDARLAVRGSHRVRRLETIDADDTDPATGKLVKYGATEGPQADHHDIRRR